MTSSSQRKLLQAIELCALLGLFVWLRRYSAYWHYGWLQFALGLAAGAIAFQGIPGRLALAERHDIQRRTHVFLAVIFLLAGLSDMQRFMTSSTTDAGFFGALMLALSLQQTIIYVWFPGRARHGTGSSQSTQTNHAR